LKDLIPNLIDNGGDSAHVVSNDSKHLTKEFEGETEKLVDRIHVDLQEVGQRGAYDKIAASFGVNARQFQRRLDHRWLSLLPCLEHIMEELDILTVFYSAFCGDDTEHELVVQILDKYLTDDGKKNVTTLLGSLRSQFRKKWGYTTSTSS